MYVIPVCYSSCFLDNNFSTFQAQLKQFRQGSLLQDLDSAGPLHQYTWF